MSRAAILAKVRAALKVEPAQDAARRAAVGARLAGAGGHLVPARAKGSGEELVRLFKSFLGAQGTDLIEVAARAEIPGAIVRYLKAQNLPLGVRTGSDPNFAELPWADAPDLVRECGPARPDDLAGLSRAIAGVAETGTLVLASGPHNPVTLAFLPDTHLVVVRRETIVGSYEEACGLVAVELGSAQLPRTLNLISGASRTGDIGGRIVMGAHGPRRLAVFLVG